MDYLYSNPILLLAPCSLHLRLLSWHGLDRRQSRSLPLYFQVTYHFFHWKKGTPFAEDQGIYNGLTWWEQIDNGKQLTRNRKFLTVVPVVLYLIASHTTDYQHPMLFFNTLAVLVLVIAKFPNMHKVRIFGINADK
ncbi:uncharacterized protein LOC105795791 isoform X2 [Gossypium raimondii]|uniref:uncharacterized protein LOC105795791 isoform X2 n=1 Tax=Gossypium raimondii TaxID=29730 RepID=UPI00227C3C33|nr:uncharacterized protein LOC105795791 isoform X2 [Gossypium raimondii]